MLSVAAPIQAETIVIGRGTGIVWEGLPFSETLSGPTYYPTLYPIFGLLSVTNSVSSAYCMDSSSLINIAGYSVYPLSGVSGVGLVPRATGTASYTAYDRSVQHLDGTIGLPQTAGISTVAGNVTSVPPNVWCLPPAMERHDQFYNTSAPRTVTMSGTWVMVADGTQQSGQFTIPQMYFSSISQSPLGSLRASILPSNLILRISTLACTINTPLTIDFGGVLRNTQVNAELASRSVPLVVDCGQVSDFYDANINVQLHSLTGLYGGTPQRLALSQGGGYITGEIDNGVTGSGDCTATSGVRFDGTPIKIGNITHTQSNVTFSNQLTWRLCSGGSSLPSGAVTASTEMMVTFN